MIEAVATPFEGAPSHVHRRWSDAFKAEVAAESFLPGANVSALARRVGVAGSQIYQWRRLAVHRGWLSACAPALPELPITTRSEASSIEIVIGGVTIRTTADSDEAHLRRVIRAVRQS